MSLGRVYLVHDDQQHQRVLKLSVALQARSKHRARELARQADTQPVLHHHENDATSYLSHHAVVSKGCGVSVLRRGRHLHEFLCERSWYLTAGRRERRCALVLTEPRSLQAGKSAWHLFGAMDQGAPMLKTWGHRGISISHYGFGRAAFGPLEQRLFARHKRWHDEQATLAEVRGRLEDALCMLTD